MPGISFSDVSVTTSGGAAGTTLNMSLPTNANVGDLLVGWVSTVSAASITATPPTVTAPGTWTNEGFTSVNGSGAQSRLTCLVKIHTSGTSWTGSFSASAFYVCHVVAYTNPTVNGAALTLSLPATNTTSATVTTGAQTPKTAGIDWVSTCFSTAFVSTGSWTQGAGILRASDADGSAGFTTYVYQGVGDSNGPASPAWTSVGTSSNTTTDRIAGSLQLQSTRAMGSASSQAVNRSNRY